MNLRKLTLKAGYRSEVIKMTFKSNKVSIGLTHFPQIAWYVLLWEWDIIVHWAENCLESFHQKSNDQMDTWLCHSRLRGLVKWCCVSLGRLCLVSSAWTLHSESPRRNSRLILTRLTRSCSRRCPACSPPLPTLRCFSLLRALVYLLHVVQWIPLKCSVWLWRALQQKQNREKAVWEHFWLLV